MIKQEGSSPFSWGLPFQPYDIQEDFMNSLYKALDEGGVALFQSPTGTGKSMSLLGGSFRWLMDHNACIEVKDSEMSKTLENEPSWVKEHLKKKLEAEKKEYIALLEKIKSSRNTEEDLLDAPKRASQNFGDHDSSVDIESDLPSDYISGDDIVLDKDHPKKKLRLMNFDELSSSDDELEKLKRVESNKTQIIFCSRTHSQLSQIVRELSRTVYKDKVTSVSLGSRKQLCVHPLVSRYSSINRMNEACRKLNQKKSCKFNDPDDIKTQRTFRKASISKVLDIEDLATLGRKLHTCPYYGSRSSISQTDFITMPYSMLLSDETRSSLGLKLKNNIVIIDEAHNLVDAITNIHSAEITVRDVEQSLKLLNQYFSKYHKRLKGKNFVNIRQILSLFRKLLEALPINDNVTSSNNEIYSIEDFLGIYKLEEFNVLKILKYVSESKLCYKVLNFNEKKEIKSKETQDTSFTNDEVNPLMKLTTFMEKLSRPSSQGKIIRSKTTLKFMMLDPSEGFKRIVKEARAVVLAGGTMDPMADFLQLIPTESKLHQFSCGHIIDKDRLILSSLSDGPSKSLLEFTFSSREKPTVLNELFQTLRNILAVVPAGAVIFFQSYEYLDKVVSKWRKEGILGNISKKKKLYIEPRSSSELDSVLKRYSIDAKDSGAVLFAVVGGKMSEGINFSDDLGRCVIMVGLPFPNPRDPETAQRLKYADELHETDSRYPNGMERLENICMKAVNQSIGRAIRHRYDYSAIILLDRRYSKSKRIRGKLPKWMLKSSYEPNSFGDLMINLSNFFQRNSKR